MGKHWRLVSLMLAEGFLSVIFFLSSALSQLSAHQFFLALLQVSSLGLSHIWRWVKSQNPTIIYGARASLLFILAEVDWVFFAHVLSPEFARAGRLSLDLPPEELGTLRTHVELETWQSNKDEKITNTTNNHVGIPPTETRCNLRFPDEIGRVTSRGWFPQNTICPDTTQMFMPGMMPGEYSHGPFIMIAISRSGGTYDCHSCFIRFRHAPMVSNNGPGTAALVAAPGFTTTTSTDEPLRGACAIMRFPKMRRGCTRWNGYIKGPKISQENLVGDVQTNQSVQRYVIICSNI